MLKKFFAQFFGRFKFWLKQEFAPDVDFGAGTYVCGGGAGKENRTQFDKAR
jgi:hypothetical protein